MYIKYLIVIVTCIFETMKAVFIMETTKNSVYFFDADQQFINDFSKFYKIPPEKCTPSEIAAKYVTIISNIVTYCESTQDEILSMQFRNGQEMQFQIRGEFVTIAVDESRPKEFLFRKIEMLILIVDFLIGPTLFTSDLDAKCNLCPDAHAKRTSAWLKVGCLLEIWEYLYVKDIGVKLGVAQRLTEIRPFLAKLGKSISPQFEFQMLAMFSNKLVYETVTNCSECETQHQFTNSDLLLTRLLLHFYFPSKDLMQFMRQQDRRNVLLKPSAPLTRDNSFGSRRSSYASTLAQVVNPENLSGNEQEMFELGDKEEESNAVHLDGSEKEQAEQPGPVVGRVSFLLNRKISLPARFSNQNSIGLKLWKLIRTNSLNSMSEEATFSPTEADEIERDSFARKSCDSNFKPQSLEMEDSEFEKEDFNQIKLPVSRSGSCFESSKKYTTLPNLRTFDSLDFEHQKRLKLRKLRSLANIREIQEDQPQQQISEPQRVLSLEDSYSSYTTAISSPQVPSGIVQYMPKYPILRQNYDMPHSRALTIFLRTYNGALVPMNLILVKTSWFDVEFAFFEHKDRQFGLREHALNMSNLINVLRDILTGSYPTENQQSMSFEFVKDEMLRLLRLNYEVDVFCKNVAKLWAKISNPDQPTDSLKTYFETYNFRIFQRLPQLPDGNLDENISKLVRIIQLQYHKYFSPPSLLELSKFDQPETEKSDILQAINSFINDGNAKKYSFGKNTGVIFSTIAMQAMSNHNFIFLPNANLRWPGFIQALFVNRTSAVFGIIPATYDEKWKLKSSNSTSNILQFLVEATVHLNSDLISTGYFFGCYSMDHYKMVYAVTLAETSRKFEKVNERVDDASAKFTFVNRHQSFIRGSVQMNFKNLLVSKLRPNADNLHLVELHAVFLRSTPNVLAFKSFMDIFTAVIQSTKLSSQPNSISLPNVSIPKC